MTDPVHDPRAEPAASLTSADDALVKQFDTELAPRLEAFRLAAASDPASALRRLYEAGEEVDPHAPPVRRILQRVAAGVVECQLLSRMSVLHARWPEPRNALAHRQLCRQTTGVKDGEIECAGEMLGASIMSAAREAAASLGEAFDVDGWTCVLVEVLAPQRRPPTGEVINIEALRLINASRRGAFRSASFAEDEEGDVS